MTEGAPERPFPQIDLAFRGGAKALAIGAYQEQAEAVRLSHGKWRGNASALDEGSARLRDFEEVPSVTPLRSILGLRKRRSPPETRSPGRRQ